MLLPRFSLLLYRDYSGSDASTSLAAACRDAQALQEKLAKKAEQAAKAAAGGGK